MPPPSCQAARPPLLQPVPPLTNATAGDPLYVCQVHLQQRLALERFYRMTTNYSAAAAYYSDHPEWAARKCVCINSSQSASCSRPASALHRALNGPWCVGAASTTSANNTCGCSLSPSRAWLTGPRPDCSQAGLRATPTPSHCNWWGVLCHGEQRPSLQGRQLCYDWHLLVRLGDIRVFQGVFRDLSFYCPNGTPHCHQQRYLIPYFGITIAHQIAHSPFNYI